MWKCGKCGEVIEDQFDSCWKCSAPREEGQIFERPEEPPPLCPKCGSNKIIRRARILDRGAEMDAELTVEIERRPAAILSKGKARSDLRAAICGSCGYTELYAENPAELYEAFLQSENSEDDAPPTQ